MAGHSKWANIKHRKAAQDSKRGKIFTKLIRDIVTAAKSGGEINDNPNLRLAVEAARKQNMTKDTIDRAIKRGTGELAGADYVERSYEGYGPSGVAVMVLTLTDNPTRTVTNVRTAFSKNGGNVGTDGSVAWMFHHKGQLVYKHDIGAEDMVMEAAIEAGADDFVAEDDTYRIYTSPTDFAAVRLVLVEKFGQPEDSGLTYIPNQMQPVNDLEVAQKIIKMIDVLEEDNDIQEVVTNMELPDDLAAKLSS